jgi:hypothetical protein
MNGASNGGSSKQENRKLFASHPDFRLLSARLLVRNKFKLFFDISHLPPCYRHGYSDALLSLRPPPPPSLET